MKKYYSKKVLIGNIVIGGGSKIKIQSMTTTNTLDIEATSQQIMALSDNGCDIVRAAVQGSQEAFACEKIKNILVKKGYAIPLVADIHFFYKTALIASDFVDKIRINPGNFIDKRANFQNKVLTENEYTNELLKTEEKLLLLVEKLKKNKCALRIGVNHGSLSDRIMSKYGNTPYGMIISAIEYIEICRKYDFENIVLSMKSSSVKIMIEAYRMLTDEFCRLNYNYPIHLGVTEAGEGLEGEIKSSIGIGSLLIDGIGDTIRVSLTDNPINEIKPAQKLIKLHESYKDINLEKPKILENKNSFLAYLNEDIEKNIDMNILNNDENFIFLNDVIKQSSFKDVVLNYAFPIVKKVREFKKNKDTRLLLNIKNLKLELENIAEIGLLFIDGYIDGLVIDKSQKDIALNILQACNKKNVKTEFISCPGCGRTLFDIQKAVRILKEKVPSIPNLKIAIMGCLVNGPGEMQDADFGYVGKGTNKVDLYIGKQVYEKDINSEEAVEKLLKLIEERFNYPYLSNTRHL